MAAFHETILGKRFFEHQLPSLIKELKRIADALENKKKQNDDEIVDELESIISELKCEEGPIEFIDTLEKVLKRIK